MALCKTCETKLGRYAGKQVEGEIGDILRELMEQAGDPDPTTEWRDWRDDERKVLKNYQSFERFVLSELEFSAEEDGELRTYLQALGKQTLRKEVGRYVRMKIWRGKDAFQTARSEFMKVQERDHRE